MVTLKNDFLTIPDAPNYEINSELIIRNKKTGRILASYTKGGCTVACPSATPCHRVWRSPKTFRSQALAAVKGTTWFPVPSLNGSYEFSRNGYLRNAFSKRILKLFTKGNYKFFAVSVGGKHLCITLDSIRWEIFGVTPPVSKSTPVSCSAFKDDLYKNFDSLSACARFLASVCFISCSSVRKWLWKRKPVVDGWKISYFPPALWSPEKEAISRKLLRGVSK